MREFVINVLVTKTRKFGETKEYAISGGRNHPVIKEKVHFSREANVSKSDAILLHLLNNSLFVFGNIL
jgi:hypothetical protein